MSHCKCVHVLCSPQMRRSMRYCSRVGCVVSLQFRLSRKLYDPFDRLRVSGSIFALTRPAVAPAPHNLFGRRRHVFIFATRLYVFPSDFYYSPLFSGGNFSCSSWMSSSSWKIYCVSASLFDAIYGRVLLTRTHKQTHTNTRLSTGRQTLETRDQAAIHRFPEGETTEHISHVTRCARALATAIQCAPAAIQFIFVNGINSCDLLQSFRRFQCEQNEMHFLLKSLD